MPPDVDLAEIRRRLVGTALRLTGNPADAEDLANVALFRLWRRMERADLEPVLNPVAFGLKTLRQAVIDNHRKTVALESRLGEMVSFEEEFGAE